MHFLVDKHEMILYMGIKGDFMDTKKGGEIKCSCGEVIVSFPSKSLVVMTNLTWECSKCKTTGICERVFVNVNFTKKKKRTKKP